MPNILERLGRYLPNSAPMSARTPGFAPDGLQDDEYLADDQASPETSMSDASSGAYGGPAPKPITKAPKGANEQLQDLLGSRREEVAAKRPGIGRMIAGTALGMYGQKGLADEVLHPGSRAFNQQRALLEESAKLEDQKRNRDMQELQKRSYQENINSSIANRLALREQGRQNELDRFAQKGGEFEDTGTPARDVQLPTPTPQSAPPPLTKSVGPDMPGDDQGPLPGPYITGTAPAPPSIPPPPMSIAAANLPVKPGYMQVPGSAPTGQRRVMPTKGELMRQASVAKQEDWITLPAQIAEEYGIAPGQKMPPQAHNAYLAAWSQSNREKNPTEAGLALKAAQGDPEAKAALDALSKTRRESKVVIQNGGAGGSTDAKDIAQAIMDGKQAPDLKGLYRQSATVRGELARNDYDLATAQRDWTTVQKHLATLNGQQQERLRQAVTFTHDSLDTIEGLYDEWQKVGPASGFKVLNRAALGSAKQLPGKTGEVAHALEAQINDLTSELGTVYKGGNSSTDESLRLAAENLKADWNEQTFKRAIGLIRKNLTIRKNSIMTSAPVGVSPDSPYIPKGENHATPTKQEKGPTFEQTRTDDKGQKWGWSKGMAEWKMIP